MSDETMMWDEVADIGALLHELDDEAFDTPSLCHGWAVRDVLGHMGLGHTTPMPAMVARIGRYAFNVTKASFTESKTLFAGQNADEIRRFWDEVMVAQHPKRDLQAHPGEIRFSRSPGAQSGHPPPDGQAQNDP
jgi:Mycothiol maleylpyruvate isomerase N-terminal domain